MKVKYWNCEKHNWRERHRKSDACPYCRVEALEKALKEIKEDIRGACGCTDGDDIRNHLEEYL